MSYWVGKGYYASDGVSHQEAEMKIQAQVHSDRVFIFIRESRYFPQVDNLSENGLTLSRQQAKEFAEQLLRELARYD